MFFIHSSKNINFAKTMIPLARYGNEGELDSTAIFLASPASSYVNGQNINEADTSVTASSVKYSDFLENVDLYLHV